MIHKEFACLDCKTSLLGMGVMRLPSGENGGVDRKAGVEMIRYAIDHGVNYIDTGYTYHAGASEKIVGKALKDGYREKVILADKMPIWLAKTEEDLNRLFEKQLMKLDVDCIDMYLIHNIIPVNWKKAKKLNVFRFLEEKKKEGKISHIGFSFHGDLNLFQEVIDAYDWDFCQIQLNYVDRDIQAGLKGLAYARERGIDVIVMEPLKGGRLTDRVPPTVQAIWDQAKADGTVNADRTPAEWAFRWVASQEGVTMILSGMSSYEQLDANLVIFSKDDIEKLSESEQDVIDRVAAEYNSKIRYQCTGCEYCLPCQKKIGIPGIIDYLNNWYAYGKNPGTKMEYEEWIPSGFHASDCVHCRECEGKCPQGLPISDIMKETVQEFGV